MFLRRWGSTILAYTIIKSIIAKILKIALSCRLKYVTVLKTKSLSFFLFLEVPIQSFSLKPENVLIDKNGFIKLIDI